MQTISILGSGWLGWPLAISLKQQNFEVKLSTTTTEKTAKIAGAQLPAYLIDINVFSPRLHEFLQADILIININRQPLESFKNLIPLIEQSCVKNIIFTSSTSVYQNVDRIVDESDEFINPQSSLYQIECLLQQNPHFQTTVLRLAGLIGGQRHPGRFFRSGKLLSQPEAAVNLAHRDDCIAVVEGVINNELWGETFNVCADSHPKKRDYYRQAAIAFGSQPPLIDESNLTANKIVSNAKIKAVLGHTVTFFDVMDFEKI